MDPIEETEPNTIVVTVTKDMDKDAVLAEILRRVEELKAEDKPDGEVVKLLDGYYKSDNHFCGIFKVCQLYSTTLFSPALILLRLMERTRSERTEATTAIL